MEPSSFTDDMNRWHELRAQLDAKLVLFGYRINDRGMLTKGAVASTLDEAAELAGMLTSELRRRGCHDALLLYCREELLRQSLFHALSEASKSIPDRLRRHTGSGKDGADLYAEAFGTSAGAPAVPINAFGTESEKSEHKGFLTMLTGIHAHYRNPRAHSTRLGSEEDRQDFFDAFALFSYVHRRLDAASVQP
jgi:uncharacterized protein (TIGR02391 family)